MKKGNNEKKIEEIAKKITRIKKPVAEHYVKLHKELKILEFLEDVEYIPTPFEIADYYRIRYKFIKLEGDMPSYLSRKLCTIYISDRYRKESYEARLLCAHELGHFFLHDTYASAMNDDILNEYLPMETMHEYEANIFSILLMPQIMAGQSWKDYSPKMLNRKIYRKILKKDI